MAKPWTSSNPRVVFARATHCLYSSSSCMKHPSHWIQLKVEQGVWRPLKTSRNGHKVSRLIFADNLLLFAEATDDRIDCMQQGLELFCNASSQHVNYSKSLMFVSPNV